MPKIKSYTTYHHIVLLSGGLSSFEAARRVINTYGRDMVELWFFDTLIEDEDLYRFLFDIEQVLGVPIIRYEEGRNPWQVFRDERFIGNSRADLCSKKLKRQLLERELVARYPDKDVILYFGLDWTEGHRIESLKPMWEKKGFAVEFPLCWEPLLFQDEITSLVESQEIEIPRLYKIGFAHNNCGGACVKAGIKQWSLLWFTFPNRYLWHEEREQEIRKYLRKNVSILRNRKYGKTCPMTLRVLRMRLQNLSFNSEYVNQYMESLDEDSSCSCFVNLQEDINLTI